MDACSVFVSVCAAISATLVLVLLKLALRRQAYSRLLPCKKLHLFNVLGHLSDIPLTEKQRKGNSFTDYLMQTLAVHTNLFRKEKLFLFWIYYIPSIIIVKAEAVEAFIGGGKHTEKGCLYNMFQAWVGTGLFTSHGTKWKTRRRLLTPSFHFEILKDFLPVINERSQALVKRLKQEINKDFTNIIPLMSHCSLEIISETALGVSSVSQGNKDSHYLNSVESLCEILPKRILNFLYRFDFLFYLTKTGKEFKHHVDIVHKFSRSVIQEKKEKFLKGESEGKKRKAFIDLLLEHHLKTQDLTEEDIREELDTFTFGGHDTTATSLMWALHLIGLNKDVQLKIHEELDGIFGSDIEREITTEDLNHMKYLECVIKETLRLFPSGPAISRFIREDTEICGHKVTKGITCSILIYQLHRDEDVFPDAEKFDPDRFLPENSVNRHPYAFIPFSAGPRNCIGQRMAMMVEKIVLGNILRNYVLDSLDGRDKVQPVFKITLKPSIPIRIKFGLRH